MTTINRWVQLTKTAPRWFDFGLVSVNPDYGFNTARVALACGCEFRVHRGLGWTATEYACDQHRTRVAF